MLSCVFWKETVRMKNEMQLMCDVCCHVRVVSCWHGCHSQAINPSQIFCLRIKLLSDIWPRLLFPTKAKCRGADGGTGPQGGAPGCVKQWPACCRPAARGEGAHGANSCHGETLTPLNAQSGKHRRAGHMPVGGVWLRNGWRRWMRRHSWRRGERGLNSCEMAY